jgi:hypothetical protein
MGEIMKLTSILGSASVIIAFANVGPLEANAARCNPFPDEYAADQSWAEDPRDDLPDGFFNAYDNQSLFISAVDIRRLGGLEFDGNKFRRTNEPIVLGLLLANKYPGENCNRIRVRLIKPEISLDGRQARFGELEPVPLPSNKPKELGDQVFVDDSGRLLIFSSLAPQAHVGRIRTKQYSDAFARAGNAQLRDDILQAYLLNFLRRARASQAKCNQIISLSEPRRDLAILVRNIAELREKMGEDRVTQVTVLGEVTQHAEASREQDFFRVSDAFYLNSGYSFGPIQFDLGAVGTNPHAKEVASDLLKDFSEARQFLKPIRYLTWGELKTAYQLFVPFTNCGLANASKRDLLYQESANMILANFKEAVEKFGQTKFTDPNEFILARIIWADLRNTGSALRVGQVNSMETFLTANRAAVCVKRDRIKLAIGIYQRFYPAVTMPFPWVELCKKA